MRTTVILVLFGMLSSLTSCAEHEIRRPEPAPAGADALRVVTYNVNYGLRGDLEGIELIAESDADIVLLDPEQEWTIYPEALHMAADWSPFNDWQIVGRPTVTIARGRVVAEAGEFVGEAGSGQFLAQAAQLSDLREP